MKRMFSPVFVARVSVRMWFAGTPRAMAPWRVGDTQRIWLYAERGFAIPQEVPTDVRRAYDRLRAAGFDADC